MALMMRNRTSQRMSLKGEAGKSPLSNGQKGGRVPEDTGEKPQECKQQ